MSTEDDNLVLLSLKETQQVLFNILVELDAIFRRNGIDYMLSFGTLLGAVRHQGFIPWDDDIDIHIRTDHFENALSVLQTELPSKYLLTTKKSENLEWDIDARVHDNDTVLVTGDENKQSQKLGVYIDLFAIPQISKYNRLNLTFKKKMLAGFYNSDNRISRMLYFFVYFLSRMVFSVVEGLTCKRMLILSDKWRGGMHHWDQIFPFKELIFEDRLFFVPNNYKNVLFEMYGDYSKIPDEGDRKKHYDQCFKIIRK